MTLDFQKVLRPLRLAISNLVARAVLSRVDDSKQMQVLQLDVLAEETRDGVERVQNYGFTSVPLAGAEAVVLFVGGRREHGLAVAVDDRRYRLTDLQPGEVALYHKDGASVVLKADGSVEVNPKPGATVKLAGDADAVALASKVDARLGNLEAAFNSHLHMAAGSPTTAPTAVLGVIPVETPVPGSGLVGSVASTTVKVS